MANLLRSSPHNFCLACPRTRLPRRSNFQRMRYRNNIHCYSETEYYTLFYFWRKRYYL